MTTAKEVKKWVASLLDARSDLALVGRNLILRPVRHVMRGIYFDASSDRTLTRPKWYVSILFHRPLNDFGLQWDGSIPLKKSTDPEFAVSLIAKTNEALSINLPLVNTIEEFLFHTEPVRFTGIGHHGIELSRYPQYHGPVLAALGRLDEAEAVLATHLERQELAIRTNMEQARAEFAKRSNSGVGKVLARFATEAERLLVEPRDLLSLVRERDRKGIGALLRSYERHSVAALGVEHLYEPTPFPVEEGAGD